MTPAPAARLATATVAAGLLICTGITGRLLMDDGLTPVVHDRPASVMDPATWQAAPTGPRVPTTRTSREVDAPSGRRAAYVVAPTEGAGLPAVVLLSGAGTRSREGMLAWAEALAAQGVVAMTLEKPPSYTVATRNFDQLAEDAAAAAASLATHDQVDPRRVGAAGLSEGAWIAALAAARHAPVSSVVLLSGPVVRPGEQALWLAVDGLRASPLPRDAQTSVAHALALPLPARETAYARHDGVGTLAAVQQPVLAVFGAADSTVPAADAAALVLDGSSPRSVRLAPGLGHGLDRGGVPDAGVATTVARWLADPATQPPGVRGVAAIPAAPAVRLPDVPAWHFGLLALSTVVTVAGWGIGRRLPAGTAPGDLAADRWRSAALGVLVLHHVGLPVLAGFGMAHVGPGAAAAWVGLKLAALVLAWRGADALVAGRGRPRSVRAAAGWVAGVGALTAVAWSGTTRSLWGPA